MLVDAGVDLPTDCALAVKKGKKQKLKTNVKFMSKF